MRLWIGEYSPSQDAFHVQPLAQALENNIRRALNRERANDWSAVAVGSEGWVRSVIAYLQADQDKARMETAEIIIRQMLQDVGGISPLPLPDKPPLSSKKTNHLRLIT
jgi:hypothetical protein